MADEQAKSRGSSTAASEEIQAKSRDVSWYSKDLKEVPEPAREVFEQYSKIPPEKMHEHVIQAREKAWDVWPFPTLGGWHFLDLNLRTFPEYPEIISRVQQGEKFLDIGCCFGQEVRRAIFDGAPARNLYGTDLQQEFLDIGHDMFLDRETCEATFIAADVFAAEGPLAQLKGEMGIVFASAFFHLWDREKQFLVAKLVAGLLRLEKGSMILGRQAGSVKPGHYKLRTYEGGAMYRHDEGSWRQLWEEVGREMGCEFEVDVKMVLAEKWKSMKLSDEDTRELRFCVRRL